MRVPGVASGRAAADLAAARARRHRERQKAGKVVLTIEADPMLIEAMLAVGMVDDRQSRSRRAVGQAIEEALQDWAEKVLGGRPAVY